MEMDLTRRCGGKASRGEQKPQQVHAVRKRKSTDAVIEIGIACVTLVGSPGPLKGPAARHACDKERPTEHGLCTAAGVR